LYKRRGPSIKVLLTGLLGKAICREFYSALICIVVVPYRGEGDHKKRLVFKSNQFLKRRFKTEGGLKLKAV